MDEAERTNELIERPKADPARPSYELFAGVQERDRGWVGQVLDFFRNRRTTEVVVVAVLVALCYVATQVLSVSEKLGAWCVAALVTLAILAIAGLGALALMSHAKDTQENPEHTAEPRNERARAPRARATPRSDSS